jgi:hypothetical protein
VGDDPADRRQSEELRLAVELAPEHSRLRAGNSAVRIDPDALHQRQIDHEPAVTERVAADAVAAGAHRDKQIVLAGEVERGDDVGDAGTAGDPAGSSVDSAVPDRAGLVVAFVVGSDHRAVNGVAETPVVGGRRHPCRFRSHATTVRRCVAARLDRISNQAVRIPNLRPVRGYHP